MPDTGGGEDGEVENKNKDVQVFNYVLCVIIGWFENYGKEDVYKKIHEVFNENEVRSAKQALCNPEKILGAIPGKNRQKIKSLIDDIYECWSVLSNANQCPKIFIESSSIKNLPMTITK